MDIRPLTAADDEAVARLLAISFGRQTADMQQLLTFLQASAPLIAFGAWDRARLAAQYSCLLRPLHIPHYPQPAHVGVSLNMAVHPDYRGRGLVKQVAAPVYEAVQAQGGIAGTGFSNAAGVKVDKRSKGYGYHVVGKMQSTVACLDRLPPFDPLSLTADFPTLFSLAAPPHATAIHFTNSTDWLCQRYAHHPFRQYCFGVGERALVVYRPFRWLGLCGASLLTVVGEDVSNVIGRWASALWQSGIRWVHLIHSPRSVVWRALQQTAVALSLPYTRTPYYLTAKPLCDNTPDCLFDFAQWQCIGGDVL